MIDELARAAGISESYTDYFGNVTHTPAKTKLAILAAMGYDVRSDADAARVLKDLDEGRAAGRIEPVYVVRAGEHVTLPFFTGAFSLGYHEHVVDGTKTLVIAAPPHAYVARALDEEPSWGFALQLYSLRSSRNWGVGDFGDLKRFAKMAASVGAGAIALNPLHQLHLSDPASASPYSPLSRLHLNALYIDVEAAAQKLGVPLNAPRELQALRDADLVDYTAVAQAKIAALRRLYDAFNAEHEPEFVEFQRNAGAGLRRVAAYEALTEQYGGGWLQWPAAYRNPHSSAVADFIALHLREIVFYEFLQWLADDQLARAGEACAGMPIGLYRDLAIGVSANSADVWADRDAFCLGLSVGAPPDALNASGQSWGLPPYNPRVLRERAYAPFINVLRANMRYAGALRIDHVMGLMRLFCIPQDALPADGAYVSYPFEDLLAIVALESHLARCTIVGEDLGTLPHGFRERMAAARIFSCRLLYFERGDDGSYRDPGEYPHDAVASTGTHDLPPLTGYWNDLPHADRVQLERLLGDLPPAASALEVAKAAYHMLGGTRAALLLVQMEDALLQAEAVNVPGTTVEEPNWRRKLRVALEALQDDAAFATILAAVRTSRSKTRELQ